MCPSTDDVILNKESIDSNTSYSYNREAAEEGLSDTPFIMDKSIENHRGDGVNCAYISSEAKWCPKE